VYKTFASIRDITCRPPFFFFEPLNSAHGIKLFFFFSSPRPIHPPISLCAVSRGQACVNFSPPFFLCPYPGFPPKDRVRPLFQEGIAASCSTHITAPTRLLLYSRPDLPSFPILSVALLDLNFITFHQTPLFPPALGTPYSPCITFLMKKVSAL